jgi:hypothetical protein
MQKLEELLLRSPAIVKQLTEEVSSGGLSLKEAERRVLEHLNHIGTLMISEVVEGVREPVIENRVSVQGRLAVFDGVRNLSFLNRFLKGLPREGGVAASFWKAAGDTTPRWMRSWAWTSAADSVR